MEFRWFCKQKDEDFETNDGELLFADGNFLPEKGRPHYDSEQIEAGGCFGGGPGRRDICVTETI